LSLRNSPASEGAMGIGVGEARAVLARTLAVSRVGMEGNMLWAVFQV
jgi:hypothetical protein